MLYAPDFLTTEVAYRQERVRATYAAAGRRRQRSSHHWRHALGRTLHRAHRPRLLHSG